jgi:hypothetical protein
MALEEGFMGFQFMGGVINDRKIIIVIACGVGFKRGRTMGIGKDPGCAIKRRPADYAFNQDNLTIVKLIGMTIVK